MNRRERFFDEQDAARREILTPEGVVLPVRLADHADRAVAFVIDVCMWLLLLLLIYVSAGLMLAHGIGERVLVPMLLFAAFIVRTAYFLYFELAWQGATPGKRINGLRVIDRQGGPLLPTAVIARNLTREFEIFLPIGIALSISGTAEKNWASALSLLWILCIGALPFLNRDRLRGGDIIAGTMVIVLPRRRLAKDLAEGDAHYTFTAQQLMAYGSFELQVLEELLRTADLRGNAEVFHSVGERIRRKIDWAGDVPLERELLFLKDFYAAQRRFLEGEQLWGRHRPGGGEKG
jgi:uncharacterized RDD family membrane protein YckC